MLYINEYDYLPAVTPARLDHLLASGWRHFGISFFRYSLLIDENGEIKRVIPLRIRLENFTLSRSQKRVITRNRDTELVIRPASIDQEKESIFERHKQRFANNVPDSISDFLSATPSTTPCRNDELCIYHEGRLIAVSFLDIGAISASAVYAIFEPEHSARSLGIYLILCGIDYAKQLDLKYYYPGYAYRERSFYDYKKRFSGIEAYDWNRGWKNYTEETE
ncbi:MAG: arginine-tRNA-protein transferase [Blastocatellia bacterium]